MTYLYHLTSWPYRGERALSSESLSLEGFTHLSTAEQVLGTARRWYSKEPVLGLLVLEPQGWGEALCWEDLYDHGERFPHLYQAIPPESVVAVLRLERDEGGEFRWPKGWSPELSLLQEGPDQGEALIEPSRRFPRKILPERAVLTLFPSVLESLAALPGVRRLEHPGSAIGPPSVFLLEHSKAEIAVCSPGVGGPLAAAALEELIALGCRKFVLCGGAGALDKELELGRLVLVDRALRDEGVSHHYLAPSAAVEVDPVGLSAVRARLNELGATALCATTWTTDALYRETPARIRRRRQAGALTVEMECASLLAVASCRGVPLVPLLFCGDSLADEVWDFRHWTEADELHDRLFWLAVEAVLAL